MTTDEIRALLALALAEAATPGPWHRGEDTVVFAVAGLDVAECYTDHFTAEQDRANAAFIAAANPAVVAALCERLAALMAGGGDTQEP